MKRIMFFLHLIIYCFTFGVDVEDKIFNYMDKHLIIDGRVPLFKNGNSLVSTKAVENFKLLGEIISMEGGKFFIEEGQRSAENFILKSDYTASENSLGIESFLVKTYYYTGGIHGLLLETPYNFFRGKELTLKDVFRDDVNYRRLLKNKIEEIIIEEDPSMFYENISIEEKEYKFHFKDDVLVISFNPYEIGPHESGIPAFFIPIEDILDYLSTSLVP